VPFVLRRDREDENGTFKLIRDCYLDGFMGEGGSIGYQSDIGIILR
jgi:hypothetical protein